MKEKGIDLSSRAPGVLTMEMTGDANCVVMLVVSIDVTFPDAIQGP